MSIIKNLYTKTYVLSLLLAASCTNSATVKDLDCCDCNNHENNCNGNNIDFNLSTDIDPAAQQLIINLEFEGIERELNYNYSDLESLETQIEKYIDSLKKINSINHWKLVGAYFLQNDPNYTRKGTIKIYKNKISEEGHIIKRKKGVTFHQSIANYIESQKPQDGEKFILEVNYTNSK